MEDLVSLKQFNPEKYIEIVSMLMDDYLGNIIIFNCEQNIFFMSNSVCKDLGCSKGDLIGRHKRLLVLEGYTERSISDTVQKSQQREYMSAKALRSGNVMFAESTPIVGKQGEIQYIVSRSQTENDLHHMMNTIYKERAQLENQYKNIFTFMEEQRLSEESTIVVKSPAMRRLFSEAADIAQTDGSVMLSGEPGVGKEVVARFIHRNSKRASKPFIPVNCAAIPKDLIESEFFGYEKGAFTGANREGKSGLFEFADGGTLFLDEIGELPIALQPKLLRVLDSGEVQRIGGKKIIKTDVRIISATNRDLIKMMKQNLFREDLYYRLNVIPIKIPPLRERREEIADMANRFLTEHNRKYGTQKQFAIQTIEVFNRYSWPGNVRELRNVVERMATVSKNNVLYLEKGLGDEEVKPEVSCTPATTESLNGYDATLKEAVHNFETAYIKAIVEMCGGNVTEAAQKLGIHRSSIYRKLNM